MPPITPLRGNAARVTFPPWIWNWDTDRKACSTVASHKGQVFITGLMDRVNPITYLEKGLVFMSHALSCTHGQPRELSLAHFNQHAVFVLPFLGLGVHGQSFDWNWCFMAQYSWSITLALLERQVCAHTQRQLQWPCNGSPSGCPQWIRLHEWHRAGERQVNRP